MRNKTAAPAQLSIDFTKPAPPPRPAPPPIDWIARRAHDRAERQYQVWLGEQERKRRRFNGGWR